MRTFAFLLISSVIAITAVACGCPCEHSKYPPVPKASDVDGDAGPPAVGPAACPRDARTCPDGTSVGRQGPQCDFAPCPATK